MDNLIGKRLDGRYEIVELVGMGGMANVYKANDLVENRVVAVKVLREEFLDNEELVRRFKNESKAIGLLSHPNIVRVFDVNFSDAVQYIVMEFIDGITLKQYIDVQKPLSWRDAVHFATQILRALQHAHDRGIVHRDIKPQNIMLLADGSIKVMDFGIARFSRSETRTITDKAIGSVHYISPEQAKGDITDAKADIYSVGIMLYEMLTGCLPFESDTPVQVAIKQISDDAQRPRELVPDIPEGLEEITIKAMAKDPARRYQSASQMLRDIEDFKKNPSIVFAYKYFTDTNTERFSVKSGKEDAADRTAAKKQDAPSRKKGVKKRKSNITFYVVLGVTAAFVLCTLVLLLFTLGVFDSRHENVMLPNFVGMKYEEVIRDSNYTFKFVESPESDYNQEYEIGVIYRQSPMDGISVKDNSKVTLYVSKGNKIVTIPDLTGNTSAEAKLALAALGLQVRQESMSDSNYPTNSVVKTEPGPNTEVETGTVVTIYVNILGGNVSTTVPELRGLSLTEAYAELGKNMLSVGTVTKVQSEAPAGTVIEQSIPAGQRVAGGTQVDLVLSEGFVSKSYIIALPMPAPKAGTSGYQVTITCNGVEVYNNMLTAAQPGWSVPVTISANPTTIIVAIDGVMYATYSARTDREECVLTAGGTWTWIETYTISASGNPAGSGTVALSHTSAAAGTTVTVTITPAAGQQVLDVIVNGTSVGAVTSYSFTLSANTTITVTFGPI